jgi:hypothetical protein
MNLAVTKIAKIKIQKNGKAIAKAKLKSQIDYIVNGDKTEDGILVSASMCSPETAVSEFMNTSNMINQRSGSVLAYHLKQSFKPGEISPDEAHKIGMEFADKILEKNYQYVLATHVDKNHIHNHILFCATSPVTKGKYNDCTKERYRRERINDLICKEHGLSVIEEKSGKKGWRIWESDQYKKANKREIIQEMAEVCMKNSSNIQEFILQMHQAGCDVIEENEKFLFKINGSKKYLHENTFYTYDDNSGDKILDFKCSYKALVSYYDNKNKNERSLNIAGDRKILLFQVKDSIDSKQNESDKTSIEKMIKTLNFLEDNKITTDTGFIDLEDLYKTKYEKSKLVLSEKNEELKTLSMKINYAKTYWKFKKIYETSRKADKKFSEENSENILKFLKAKAFFESIGMEEKDLSVKKMIAEYQEKKGSLDGLRSTFESSKNEYKVILAVKMNCEMIINRKISKFYDNESTKNHQNENRKNSKQDMNDSL